MQKNIIDILRNCESTASSTLINRLKEILQDDVMTRNPELHGFKKSVLMLAALIPTLQLAIKSNQHGADGILKAILNAAESYGIHKQDIAPNHPIELVTFRTIRP